MLRPIFLLLATALYGFAMAQVPVQLRQGVYVNTQPFKNPASDEAMFSSHLFQSRHYLWLQFSQLPDENQKAQLLATGVELYDYLPTNTFFASFPLGYDYASLYSKGVYAVSQPQPHHKIDPQLFDATAIPWAVAGDSQRLVRVSYINRFTRHQFAEALINAGVIFTFINDAPVTAPELYISASFNQMQQIANHPLTQYIEAIGAPPTLDDMQGVSNHRNNVLYTGDNYATGKKLDGKGVVIAMGDDGPIGPHIDFQGRLLLNGTGSSGTHGDHVAGIILGAPNYNPIYRGQAPGAKLRVYNGFGLLDLFPTLYTTNNVRITTHSLAQSCNAGYNGDARESDQQIRTHASLMHVHSCGNEGNSTCGGLTGGWRTITGGYKAAKNVMAIGNLSKSDIIASGSSKGPTPDGRIKPDVSAVGSSVMSTQPNNTYASMSGTSMASPAVAGNLAVLYQAYKEKNGIEPNSGLIKAIVMNTADDLGNSGPDYTYGWGRINARRAVECIDSTRYFVGAISQGQTQTINLDIPNNVAVAKIMVYWVDREGTVGAAKSLVNDIESWVVSPHWGGEIFMPWRLFAGNNPTAASCAAPAWVGIDTTNNVEQIQLDEPGAGTYQIKIKGATIPFGPQTYFVVYDFIYNNKMVVTHPFGGESFVGGETQRIRWDAPGNTSNFTISYSINEGASWNTITSSASPSTRYYDWVVPGFVTGKARVRVARGSLVDVSDTNFTILGVPSTINFVQVCEGQSRISWSAVTGAIGYDVFQLGSEYMEQVASTTATNVLLTGLGSSQNYFAVRAKLGDYAYGRRSVAVSHTNTSSVACSMPVTLLSFKASKQGSGAVLRWTTAQEINIIRYVVERSATATFDVIAWSGEVIARNSTSIQEYNLLDKSTELTGTWYYRLRIIETGKESFSKVEVLKWNIAEAVVRIYPNPVTSVLNVQLGNGSHSVAIDIINSIGARVQSAKVAVSSGTATVDVNTLPAGNYFLLIKQDSGEIIRQKFTVVK